jgi:hypothetical protein
MSTDPIARAKALLERYRSLPPSLQRQANELLADFATWDALVAEAERLRDVDAKRKAIFDDRNAQVERLTVAIHTLVADEVISQGKARELCEMKADEQRDWFRAYIDRTSSDRIRALEDALRENVCHEGGLIDGRCYNCGRRGCGEARELLLPAASAEHGKDRCPCYPACASEA